MPRWQADDRALDDLKEWLTDKNWQIFREEAEKVTDAQGWITINNSFGFIGVQGYPVHAFGRRYCLIGYRDWMHSETDGGPIETDAQGFVIKD